MKILMNAPTAAMTVRISNSNQWAFAQVLRLHERRLKILWDFQAAQRNYAKMVEMDWSAKFEEEEGVLLVGAHYGARSGCSRDI